MRAAHFTCLIALPGLLLSGCASRPPASQTQVITPGVEARISAGLERVEGVRGIDSDVARFEGRDGAVTFDRGMYGGQIPLGEQTAASTVLTSGQTLDRSATAPIDGDYPYRITMVERVQTDTPAVGGSGGHPVYLSIGVFCHAIARCEAIADDIQATLSIRDRHPE